MLLDDISIFNSELAESDVAILFNNGRAGDIASLNPFCWWKMSQGDIENEIENDGTSNILLNLKVRQNSTHQHQFRRIRMI